MHQGFKPVYDKNSKILILGSFPSVKSREVGFYYGHKQNRFWKMLSQVFNEEIKDDIPSKISFLHKYHIALYDVIIESDLTGSSDSALEKSSLKTGAFAPLLPPNTKVEKILCNGKTAYNLFIENYTTDIPVYCMPSTSPANPRYNFETWQTTILH